MFKKLSEIISEILNRQNVKKTLISFLFLGIGSLLHFFMHSQISSYFGLDNYGYFSFFMAITAFLFPISTLGFSASSVNILPTLDTKATKNKFILLGLKITLLSILILALLFLTFELLGVFEDYNSYILFFSLFPLIALARYFQQIFRGLKKPIQSLLPEQILLPITVLVGMYIFSPSIKILVLLLVIGWSIATAYALFNIRNRIVFKQADKKVRKNWISRSLVMIVGTLASIFLFRIDIILIGIFMNPDDIGIYNACLKIALLIVFPLTALDNIGISILAERYKLGFLPFKRYFDKLQLASISLLIISCLIIILFKDIFFELFGIDGKYSYILYILIGGQIINGISGPVAYAMNILNKEKIRLIIVSIACLFAIVANMIFIPLFGLMGAAVTTAVIMIVQNAVMYYYVRLKS